MLMRSKSNMRLVRNISNIMVHIKLHIITEKVMSVTRGWPKLPSWTEVPSPAGQPQGDFPPPPQKKRRQIQKSYENPWKIKLLGASGA